jgi:hypothetical protein
LIDAAAQQPLMTREYIYKYSPPSTRQARFVIFVVDECKHQWQGVVDECRIKHIYPHYPKYVMLITNEETKTPPAAVDGTLN